MEELLSGHSDALNYKNLKKGLGSNLTGLAGDL
jgi:hypothetical protein